ncbi:Aste57867_22530 [Aphanomyces stellatus]|uniref:Aste57867_22530 protein n=1 Tax=Aphanomyces stellatus TaxID=120398 RepID=A0A485LL09_9STRA|nr:hypothetical protein As57867_022460 [Aphanomyces stellatus]VFT99190.1 Aste57867_22530 [Aphanomyces stellatus]
MYWSLANDLAAVALNSSGIPGLSLVRSSPVFANMNTSLQTILQLNGTLHAPLGRVFTVVTSTFGQFGSIDMTFLPCPKVAKEAIYRIQVALRRTLFENLAAQSAYDAIPLVPSSAAIPAPKAWTDLNFIPVGGSPVCPEVAGIGPISAGMLTLLSWNRQCLVTATNTFLQPTPTMMIVSAIFANVTHASSLSAEDLMTATCAQNPTAIDMCLASLNQFLTFATTLLDVATLAPFVVAATQTIRALNVSLVQYGGSAPRVTFNTNNILSQVEFTFFAWHFLFGWTDGTQ